jgi:hypothetical protein
VQSAGRAPCCSTTDRDRAGTSSRNADLKRHFCCAAGALDPEFTAGVRGIKMDGPCGKLNLVLSEEPKLSGADPAADALQRAQFTIVPWLDGAQRISGEARLGRIADPLWIDCLVPSLIDPSLATPGARDDMPRRVPAVAARSVGWIAEHGQLDNNCCDRSRAVPAVGRRGAEAVPPPTSSRLRDHRGQHLPRRPAAGPVVLHAPCRVRPLRDAGCCALPLRRRHTRRRRDRRPGYNAAHRVPTTDGTAGCAGRRHDHDMSRLRAARAVPHPRRWSAGFINYLLRNNFSVAIPSIREFRFTSAEIGWVLGNFNLTYTLFQIPGGIRRDLRLSPRR